MSPDSEQGPTSNDSPADASAAVPIYFATTSNVKYRQYSIIFADHGVEIRRGTAITSVLMEPQADHLLDPAGVSVVSHPLRQAARFVTRSSQIPYMVEDTMLFIEAFSRSMEEYIGLPGADTKNWWHNLGADGVLRLLHDASTRRAAFICQLGAYLGGSVYEFSRATLLGEIADGVRVSQAASDDVPLSNPFFFHQVFIPHGDTRTLAEMSGADFNTFDYRRECAARLIDALGRRGALHEDRQMRLSIDLED